MALLTLNFLITVSASPKSKEEAEIASDHIRKDLLCAGAYWSIKKSQWLLSNVKTLASFAGQINSLSVVVGNCCHLTSCCSQMAIASATSWDSSVRISDNIRQEIRFWNKNIVNLNSTSSNLTPRIWVAEAFLIILTSRQQDYFWIKKGSSIAHSENLLRSHAIKSFLPVISNS